MLRQMREALWPRQGMTEGAARALNVLRALVLVLLVAVALLASNALTESSRIDTKVQAQTAKLQAQTQSQCAFYADLASADSTLGKRVSELGVKILADSRRIHRELRCGPLRPPSARLRELAAKFHIDLE
jgi:hypothetical protein